jgi:hypothetical protein
MIAPQHLGRRTAIEVARATSAKSAATGYRWFCVSRKRYLEDRTEKCGLDGWGTGDIRVNWRSQLGCKQLEKAHVASRCAAGSGVSSLVSTA